MDDKQNSEIIRQVMQGNLQEDVVIVDEMHEMPLMHEEYLTHYFYIGMCLSGYAKGRYDYKDYHFKAGDICWLLPDHVMRNDECSEDYRVMSVFINKSYFQNLQRLGGLPRYYLPFFVASISLTPQQFQFMHNGFKMVGLAMEANRPYRDEIICKICDIQAIVGDDFILQQRPEIVHAQKMHIRLFEQFYEAITQHYRESHEVAFYARLLALTPKYFAGVILKVSGRRATDWINHYVTVQAKWMLQHHHHKSIQQIAMELGFSEQASFTRFFKENVGMTPTAFRSKI